MADSVSEAVQSLDVPLERDVFLRSLLRELSGALESVVGLEESEGFISIVGNASATRSTPTTAQRSASSA